MKRYFVEIGQVTGEILELLDVTNLKDDILRIKYPYRKEVTERDVLHHGIIETDEPIDEGSYFDFNLIWGA